MIRALNDSDNDAILEIINDAARAAYKGVIPADCWKEPYMPEEELIEEIGAGVAFWGCSVEGKLAGVMGRQDLGEVVLIRHAYTRPAYQRQGIGGKLLTHLRQGVSQPLLVGTWAASWWAIQFYQRHGFRLVTPVEKDRLLQRYWNISDRQTETSVVLVDENSFPFSVFRFP